MSYDADQLADRERHVRRDGDAGNLKSRSDGILNHRLNEVWVSCFSVTLLVKVAQEFVHCYGGGFRGVLEYEQPLLGAGTMNRIRLFVRMDCTGDIAHLRHC